MSLDRSLSELLTGLFAPDDLLDFLRDGPDGTRIVASLSATAPPARLSADAVTLLRQFGRVDDDFFDRLLAVRQGRESDIRTVGRIWALETASREAEERVHAAGQMAEATGAQVESRIARKAVLGATLASLLVIVVAVVAGAGLLYLNSRIEQVEWKVSSRVDEFVAKLEELRQTALAAQRLGKPDQEVAPTALAEARSERPELFQEEGDPRPPMGGKLWPVGQTLGVRFLGGTPEEHRQVQQWAAEWSEHANLHLDFTDPESTELRISFEPGNGSWSVMGTDALAIPQDSPNMNLGWLDRGNVLHQFGHVLGLIHEHQNPNASIEWDEEAVIAALSGPPNFWPRDRVEQEVLRKADSERYGGYRVFDPESVMMYRFPAAWTRDGRGFESTASHLSDSDKAFAARLYPRSPAAGAKPGGGDLESAVIGSSRSSAADRGGS